MIRRLHVASVRAGLVDLAEAEAHHARTVLRLTVGTEVELFTDDGTIGHGAIERSDDAGVTVRIESIETRTAEHELTIASAIPKGDRADWIIEKLSELGVTRFIPLETARSVVHPQGQSKRDRWLRIATEATKQSRRAGVMQIDPLTQLAKLLPPSPCTQGEGGGEGSASAISNVKSQTQTTAKTIIFLSTEGDAQPLVALLRSAIRNPQSAITLLIGPEGGWTPDEIALFHRHGLTGAKLTATILRVETAAIAAAAIAASILG